MPFIYLTLSLPGPRRVHKASDPCLLQTFDGANVDVGAACSFRPPFCTLRQSTRPLVSHGALPTPIARHLVSHPQSLSPSRVILSRDEKLFRPVPTYHGDIEHCLFNLTFSAPCLHSAAFFAHVADHDIPQASNGAHLDDGLPIPLCPPLCILRQSNRSRLPAPSSRHPKRSPARASASACFAKRAAGVGKACAVACLAKPKRGRSGGTHDHDARGRRAMAPAAAPGTRRGRVGRGVAPPSLALWPGPVSDSRCEHRRVGGRRCATSADVRSSEGTENHRCWYRPG